MQHSEERLQRNVQRTVMLEGLRRIHRLLASWEREEKSARRIAAIVCGALLLVVAAGALYMLTGATLITID